MTSCGFKALIDLQALLPSKRLNGYISDGHLGLTSSLTEVWGPQKMCWESTRVQSCLPHLPLTKLAYHSTIGEKPDWSDEKPQAAFPSPSPGTSWAKHHRAVLSDHSSNFWYGSCWGTAIGTCIVLFLQNDNSSATTVKSSPLQKRLSAHTPQSRLKPNKTQGGKTPNWPWWGPANAVTLKHCVQPT